MTCTLDVHHAVMSAALRRAMAKCQRPETGFAAYGILGPPRAAGGGDRAGAELLRHAQGAVRGPDATVGQGARGTTGSSRRARCEVNPAATPSLSQGHWWPSVRRVAGADSPEPTQRLHTPGTTPPHPPSPPPPHP